MHRQHKTMLAVWNAPATAGTGVILVCGESASYRIKNFSVKIR